MPRHFPAISAVALAATFLFACSKSTPEDVAPETPSVSTEGVTDTMQTGAAAVGDSVAAQTDSIAANTDSMAAPEVPAMDSVGAAVGDTLTK